MKTLSASKIGFPCARNLWYHANGYKGETSERSNRIFDVGNALEPMVVKWLREDGWDVEYNPGSQQAALKLIVPVKGGELVGHPDAFISKGAKSHILVDIKTMNDRAFRLWKREGTLKKYPQYVEQLHVYGMGFYINGLGVVGINKNNSDMWIDFFDYNPILAEALKSRAEEIFALDNPPEADCPRESWCCGYCEFAGLCEMCKARRDTSVGEDAATTNDKEIIDAMELLRDARSMSKDAKDLETMAKNVLDIKVRQQGLKSVASSELILTLKEIVKNQFDTTAFKKAHPEMLSDYTTQVTSLTYELKEAN